MRTRASVHLPPPVKINPRPSNRNWSKYTVEHQDTGNEILVSFDLVLSTCTRNLESGCANTRNSQKVSTEKQPLTLASLAESSAKHALVEIAQAGLAQSYFYQYDFEVVAYGTRTQYRDSIYTLFPQSLQDREQRIKDGVFKFHYAREVFALCFTKEALDFLIDHSYNPHFFWSMVHQTASLFLREDKRPLPFTLEDVKTQVIGDRTPFGLVSSPYSDLHMGRLKAAAKKNKGKFDPNKLPAAYAFELIRAGFLFRQKLEDYRAQPVLVVNPLWQHLLDDAVTATTTDGEPATFTLSAHGSVNGLLTIEPAEGYTAETVARLLTDRRAKVKDGEVIVNDIAPKTGYTVVAKIVGDSDGTLRNSNPVWSVIR